MTPGPTMIRECSACGKHIAQQTTSSGNTFGARFWTDGKRDAPMLPDEPFLVKCQHCSALVWIYEQKKVGEIDPWGPTTHNAGKFPDARPASNPTLHEYAGFLEAGESDKAKERYVRVRAWWAGKAEALRELGEFEEAQHLLETEFKEQFTQAVAIIRELSHKRVSIVTEM